MKKYVAYSILTTFLLLFSIGGTVSASEPPKPVINSYTISTSSVTLESTLLHEPPKPVINGGITPQFEPPKPVIN